MDSNFASLALFGLPLTFRRDSRGFWLRCRPLNRFRSSGSPCRLLRTSPWITPVERNIKRSLARDYAGEAKSECWLSLIDGIGPFFMYRQNQPSLSLYICLVVQQEQRRFGIAGYDKLPREYICATHIVRPLIRRSRRCGPAIFATAAPLSRYGTTAHV
jgi:hypothetical protein